MDQEAIDLIASLAAGWYVGKQSAVCVSCGETVFVDGYYQSDRHGKYCVFLRARRYLQTHYPDTFQQHFEFE